MTAQHLPFRQRLIRSSFWAGGGAIVGRIVDLVMLLLLARILVPADFGLVAIASSILSVIEMLTALQVGAVLFNMKAITDDYVNTAFTLGLIRGGLLCALIGACSPWFGSFYGDERLGLVLIAMSTIPLIRSLTSPGLLLNQRQMNFRTKVLSEVIGKFLSLVIAIPSALLLRNYWAIVMASVSGMVFSTTLSYLFAPKLPKMGLLHWRNFVRTTGWLTASELVSAITWQFDRLFLGRFLGPATLGLYSMAYNLASTVEQFLVRPMTQGPLLSGYSLINDDLQRMQSLYRRVSSGVAIVGCGIMYMLSAFAWQIVGILFDEKWESLAPLLSGFSIALLPSALRVSFAPLMTATGRPALITQARLAMLIYQTPMIVTGYHFFGVNGVIVAIGLGGLTSMILEFFLIRRVIAISIMKQIGCQLPPILLGGLFHVVAWTLPMPGTGAGLIALLLGTATGCALAGCAYATAILLLWIARGKPDGLEREVLVLLEKLYSAFQRWRRGQRGVVGSRDAE